MPYQRTTVSEELDPDLSRINIKSAFPSPFTTLPTKLPKPDVCTRIFPTKQCTITVQVCPTCRSSSHQQYQAKVLENNRCLVKAGCEDTEEEALRKLYLWVQNYWAYKGERFHA